MPISLDHEAYLGDRVELIAVEKAGIIKRGCPVVVGQQPFDAAREVLVDTAERLACPLTVYGEDFLAFEENGRMIYQDNDGLFDMSLPQLAGRHQIANAAAAIATVKAAGFPVGLRSAEAAMERVVWPGRLQRLPKGALSELGPEGAEIWIDGGHNPGAGEAIAEALASCVLAGFIPGSGPYSNEDSFGSVITAITFNVSDRSCNTECPVLSPIIHLGEYVRVPPPSGAVPRSARSRSDEPGVSASVAGPRCAGRGEARPERRRGGGRSETSEASRTPRRHIWA